MDKRAHRAIPIDQIQASGRLTEGWENRLGSPNWIGLRRAEPVLPTHYANAKTSHPYPTGPKKAPSEKEEA